VRWAAKPQISFADWELLQGILLEPLLQSISDFCTIMKVD